MVSLQATTYPYDVRTLESHGDALRQSWGRYAKLQEAYGERVTGSPDLLERPKQQKGATYMQSPKTLKIALLAAAMMPWLSWTAPVAAQSTPSQYTTTELPIGDDPLIRTTDVSGIDKSAAY